MKQSEIRLNLRGLEEMRREIGDAYRARVGVLGSKAARTDGGPLNNAEIGFVQQFGSISQHIPPRDFLIMPIEKNRRELAQAMNAPSVREAFNAKDYKRVFELLGVKASAFILLAFDSRGFGLWAPNAPSTIASKGSDAPLIDEGELRRAITSDVVKKSEIA